MQKMYYTRYKYNGQLVSKPLTKNLETAKRQAAKLPLGHVVAYPGRELVWVPESSVIAAMKAV